MTSKTKLDSIDSTLQKEPLDVSEIRKDFPLFVSREGAISESTHPPITYLDSAASSQQPRQVLSAMESYYETTHANVHRGVYAMAEESTRRFEEARSKVGRFINAPLPEVETVFTKNATESINLVAQTWGRRNLKPGDAVLLTIMEHHANMVPWLMLAAEIGFELRYLEITDDGELVIDDLEKKLEGVKLVGITLMSNVLGTINDISSIASMAHRNGAVVLADGAQYVPGMPTDVQALNCDFLAFSGHKMLGPTGIGVLWARKSLLEEMPPFLGGGEMIDDVRLDGFMPTAVPWKFEAGTPPIAEAIGLGAAIDYLEKIGMDKVREHELKLVSYAMNSLKERFGDDLTIHGPADPSRRGGVLSIAYKGIHPHDLAQVLDEYGVCIRAGHHCAKPLMRRLGVPATARASVYIYNDHHDIDVLSEALAKAGSLFGDAIT